MTTVNVYSPVHKPKLPQASGRPCIWIPLRISRREYVLARKRIRLQHGYSPSFRHVLTSFLSTSSERKQTVNHSNAKYYLVPTINYVTIIFFQFTQLFCPILYVDVLIIVGYIPCF